MRLLIVVFGVFCFASSAAAASGNVKGASASEGLRDLSKPELKVAPGRPHFRCTKKIPIGPDKSETACLMTKRNAFASAPRGKAPPAPQKETGAHEQERKPTQRH